MEERKTYPIIYYSCSIASIQNSFFCLFCPCNLISLYHSHATILHQTKIYCNAQGSPPNPSTSLKECNSTLSFVISLHKIGIVLYFAVSNIYSYFLPNLQSTGTPFGKTVNDPVHLCEENSTSPVTSLAIMIHFKWLIL